MIHILGILFCSSLFCLGLGALWMLGLGITYLLADDDRRGYWSNEVRVASGSILFGAFWWFTVPLGLVGAGIYGLYRSQKDSHV